MTEITLRPAETPADFRALQDAQRRTWGITDDSLVIPVASMVAASHFGGLVLGAFRTDGSAVALSFAFLGRLDDRPMLYSQLVGVVPGYQGLGLGARIKEAQRDFCRGQGISLIVWAFDPMQAGNAAFNLQKLGATSRRFVADMYGPRTDALNAGFPTDRLIAEWEIDAAPPVKLTDEEIHALPKIMRPGPMGSTATAPADAWAPPWSATPEGPSSLLEVPATISEMRRDRPQDALYWQVLVGNALVGSFEMGYRAVGFARTTDESGPRCYYILERDNESINARPQP